MINIGRDGTDLRVELTPGYPLSGRTFVATWNAGAEWACALLWEHFHSALGKKLAEIRAEAYEAGWRDAKAKRRKADWQSPMWVLALAVLLTPSLASAAPIIPPMPSCHCTLVDVTPIPDPHVDTTGGWDLFVGTAEEKAAAQLADLLHEPPSLDRILEWACADKPPIVVPPDGPHGGGGAGGSGGGGNTPVAEPSLFALAAVAAFGFWKRRS